MDRSRRTLGRIPGLSFFAAAALTVALEAAIGIGASLSMASGLPSLHPPKASGITSTVGSTVTSATSTASSATSTASSAVSSTVHKVTSTASSTQQSLVNTASNLTSTASSTAGQVVTSTAGGSSASTASPTAATPATSASSASSTSASPSSGGSQGAASGNTGSNGHGTGSRPDAAQYRKAHHAAQHPWFVRRLVTRLSGCVDDLPRQSQQVLVLAAGVGSSRPNSPTRVAHILHLSVSRVRQLENSSAVALERASSHGTCESASGALPASAVAVGVQPGLALVSGPQAGAQTFLPAAQALGANSAQAHKSAVRGLHLKRGHGGGPSAGTAPVQKSSLGSPSAAGSASAWIFVLLGLLLGAGFLLIGRQRLRVRPSGAAAGAGAGEGAAAGLVGASVTQASAAPATAPPAAPTTDPESWDPPTVLGAGAAAAAAMPAAVQPDQSSAEYPDTPSIRAEEPLAVPSAGLGVASPTSGERPRVRTGRNWVRRHRQAAAMAGAVAGATLAMMLSTAGRSARVLSRRRRRRRRRWRR